MRLQNDILLTPAQKRAMEGMLGGLPAGDVFVLRSAAGMGRTTVLRRVHDAAGGALVGVREFMRSLAAREPAAIEEAFLDMVEQALAVHLSFHLKGGQNEILNTITRPPLAG